MDVNIIKQYIFWTKTLSICRNAASVAYWLIDAHQQPILLENICIEEDKAAESSCVMSNHAPILLERET